MKHNLSVTESSMYAYYNMWRTKDIVILLLLNFHSVLIRYSLHTTTFVYSNSIYINYKIYSIGVNHKNTITFHPI